MDERIELRSLTRGWTWVYKHPETELPSHKEYESAEAAAAGAELAYPGRPVKGLPVPDTSRKPSRTLREFILDLLLLSAAAVLLFLLVGPSLKSSSPFTQAS